jgi:crossover junction endodeoxyribonuclease RuvC
VRILGIDPSTTRLGYALVVVCERLRIADMGTLPAIARDRNADVAMARRLATLSNRLGPLIERLSPDVIALEWTAAMPQRGSMALPKARGMVLTVAGQYMNRIGCRVEIMEYNAATVKKAIAGHGRADKDMVAAGIGRLMGMTGFQPGDAADALAMALCHAIRTGS